MMTITHRPNLFAPGHSARTLPEWVNQKNTAIKGLFLARADLIFAAQDDGIPQVAPILAATGGTPEQCRARFGKGLWRQIHHSDLKHNVWRARLSLEFGITIPRMAHIAPNLLYAMRPLIKRYTAVAALMAAHFATNRQDLEEAAMLVRDTLHMDGTARESWSLRRLREEHDRLAAQHARRRASPVPFAEPWVFEAGGYKFTRLISRADFAEEGLVMKHCISSYQDHAAHGKEVAFRVEGKERASASFSKRHLELKGRLNSAVSDDLADVCLHQLWLAYVKIWGQPK
jgi:hypothetical protein